MFEIFHNSVQLLIRLPSNLRLAPLTLMHADPINSAWPHRYEGSDQFVRYSIKNHLSLGLFDENGDLLASSLMYDSGALGLVQVDKNHLRKGFGSLIVKAMSKKIAEELEIDITATIVESNKISSEMFTKLGFKPIDKHSWFGLKIK